MTIPGAEVEATTCSCGEAGTTLERGLIAGPLSAVTSGGKTTVHRVSGCGEPLESDPEWVHKHHLD